MILAGGAAGVAAAFNTPLAGIVFAIEEMGRTYQSRTNGLVLSAVILAGIAALALVGNYNYFGEIAPQHVGAREWLLVVACGTLGGLAGSLFSRAALEAIRRIRRSTRFSQMRRALVVALACGGAVAVIGVATGGQTFGTGYEQASAAVGGTPSPWYYFAAKLAATLLSMVSGIPGGIFAPSLSVGAGLGSDIALVIGTSISLGAVLGMAGYFAGVVQAPMTAFVIVLEMTGSHGIVVPLMCAAMLGYGTSRLVAREPLYHALSRLFVADVIRQRRAAASAGTDDRRQTGA
jgi:H+/Cl- antiporter ClcA